MNLTFLTILFITAIHTVLDSITKPSDRNTVCLIFTSKLIFLTLCYTIHLFKYIYMLQYLSAQITELYNRTVKIQPHLLKSNQPFCNLMCEEFGVLLTKLQHYWTKIIWNWKHHEWGTSSCILSMSPVALAEVILPTLSSLLLVLEYLIWRLGTLENGLICNIGVCSRKKESPESGQSSTCRCIYPIIRDSH